ncbi:hypothetical protein B0H14DRAFT_3856564 [Mycena olivaceomarginata]|nr:hypothetical protein B0H14DRAFT_3856564 [Mycena olivaceomarginata]
MAKTQQAVHRLTDEPILRRRSGMLPIALSRKRQRAATPPSRRSSKKTKREVTDSSSDELEISDVCRMVKLKPRTPPTSCLGSAQGPPLYLPACLSTRPLPQAGAGSPSPPLPPASLLCCSRHASASPSRSLPPSTTVLYYFFLLVLSVLPWLIFEQHHLFP